MVQNWLWPWLNTPVPMPVTTAWSVPPITPADTTDGVTGPCGAMLGRYMQPKPSQDMSNSTNDGVMAAPWRRTSRGVVMDTRHFTRVSNTGPPLNAVDLATTSPDDAACEVVTAEAASPDDGDTSVTDSDDDEDAGGNLSMVAANVRPVKVSASLLASCCSSLSVAQNRGTPSRRKSLQTNNSKHAAVCQWRNVYLPRDRKLHPPLPNTLI